MKQLSYIVSIISNIWGFFLVYGGNSEQAIISFIFSLQFLVWVVIYDKQQ